MAAVQCRLLCPSTAERPSKCVLLTDSLSHVLTSTKGCQIFHWWLPQDNTNQPTYDFSIPSNAKAGPAIFSWSWSNFLGNREFYQDCAPIIIGGNGDSTLGDLPDMFVANLPAINSCKNEELVAVAYPNPGADVETGSSPTKPPTGDCGKVLSAVPPPANPAPAPPTTPDPAPAPPAGATMMTATIPTNPQRVTTVMIARMTVMTVMSPLEGPTPPAPSTPSWLETLASRSVKPMALIISTSWLLTLPCEFFLPLTLRSQI